MKPPRRLKRRDTDGPVCRSGSSLHRERFSATVFAADGERGGSWLHLCKSSSSMFRTQHAFVWARASEPAPEGPDQRGSMYLTNEDPCPSMKCIQSTRFGKALSGGIVGSATKPCVVVEVAVQDVAVVGRVAWPDSSEVISGAGERANGCSTSSIPPRGYRGNDARPAFIKPQRRD